VLSAVIALLFGCVFGSFLNVVITRIPRHESVVYPASHCRSCGRALSWWENIPVASYIALGGRCRTCRAPIGIRHLLVELGSGLIAAVAVRWLPLPAGGR